MSASFEFIEFLSDQFQTPVHFRAMFGGMGLFQDGIMFGLIAGETLYLKADAETVGAFEEANMPPFIYERAGKPMTLSYRECPTDALEDPELLEHWRRLAFDAALRAQKKKQARK